MGSKAALTRCSRSGLGFVALTALWLWGCGSSSEPTEKADPEPQGSGSAVLAEHARVLDAAGAAALRSVELQEEHFELAFAAISPVLSELSTGDVLIVGPTKPTPNGALLKVEDIAEVDQGLVVGARAAALGEAFDELQISLAAVLTPRASSTLRTPQSAGGLGKAQQALGVSFPFSLRSGSGDDTISLDGSLSLDSSIDLKLDFDFAALQLDELSLSFAAEETFTANLVGQGQTTIDETLPLGSIAFSPITLMIPTPVGVVPVVLTPGVKLEAGINGGIQGDFETSVTQRASFTAGVGYRDGEFGGFSDDDSDFDVEPATYAASASIRAWAGPKLEVLIYGAVGPYVGVDGFVEAAASVQAPPVCIVGTVDAGLTATAGMEFLADYSTTLFEHRYPLASFDSCSEDPDAAARPALTWARTYGRAASPGETVQAVLQVSDGGYFVLGQSALFEGVTGFAAATWALRLDALGNVIWQKAYKRVDQGLARAAAEVSDGFLVAGNTGVLKLDSGGNVVWSKHYTANEGLEIASMDAQADGGAVLAGTLALADKAWAMKIDAQGDVVWSHSYAGDHFTRVRTTSDAGTILTGQIASDTTDFYLVRLDAEGEVVWQRALDNRYDNSAGGDTPPSTASSADEAYDVIETPSGGYVLVGESYGNFPIPEPASGGYYASTSLELDQQGELSGAGSTLYRAPDTALYGGAYAVAVRPNGSTLVVARRADSAPDLLSNEDVLLIQDGTFAVFGGSGNDAAHSGTLEGAGRGMPLQITADGGAVLALTSNSFAGQDEVWLLKLNRTASIDSAYRSSLPGASYSNELASSAEITLAAADVRVSSEAFSVPASVETTELVTSQQNP